MTRIQFTNGTTIFVKESFNEIDDLRAIHKGLFITLTQPQTQYPGISEQGAPNKKIHINKFEITLIQEL